MAATPEVRSPQAGVMAVHRKAALSLNIPQANSLAVYNVPADQIKSTVAGVTVPFTRISQSMRVSQASVMAVVTGLVANPRLRSWYYTLDGHDMFVLRLGTAGKTLVFDLSTNQWAWWTSPDSPRWRPSCSTHWRTSGSLAGIYGSDVVVGDDSTGVLWVLDPMKGEDDRLIESGTIPFERIATGQMTATGRTPVPIYSVGLSASLGNPKSTDATVLLNYSDDMGKTFVTANEPMVSESGNYDQEFIWRSLGQVRAPGRLFRIVDHGAFARIDSLDVNEK